MQQALFHEDVYEALRTDVLASGGFKKVGHCLWPELTPDRAGQNLNNCLNRSRQEKLDMEQVMLVVRVARDSSSFATIFYLSENTGFTRPSPIEPDDEMAALQRKFLQGLEDQKRLVARLEALGAK